MSSYSSNSGSNSTSGNATWSKRPRNPVERARCEMPIDSIWILERERSRFEIQINKYQEIFNDNRGICEFTIMKALDNSSSDVGKTNSIVFEDVQDLKKVFIDRNQSAIFQNKVVPSAPTMILPTAVILDTKYDKTDHVSSLDCDTSPNNGNKITGTAPIGPGCWVLAQCAPCFCGWIHKMGSSEDDTDLLCMYPWMCYMIPCCFFPICMESKDGSMVYHDLGSDSDSNIWAGESPSKFRMHGGSNPKNGSVMVRLCSR